MIIEPKQYKKDEREKDRSKSILSRKPNEAVAMPPVAIIDKGTKWWIVPKNFRSNLLHTYVFIQM